MSAKYEYKYVEVMTSGLNADDYKKVIDEHVNEGWRFVSTIDKTRITLAATPKIELVFEKEIEPQI